MKGSTTQRQLALGGRDEGRSLVRRREVSSDSHCTWMSGGFFLVCTETGSGTIGKMHSMGVLGYDAAAKSYSYNGFSSMGENEHANGYGRRQDVDLHGRERDERQDDEGPLHPHRDLATAYDFKLETSGDGRPGAP